MSIYDGKIGSEELLRNATVGLKLSAVALKKAKKLKEDIEKAKKK